MLDVKRVRPLDAVIVAVAAIVLVLGGFLGYSVWANQRKVVESTPAMRAINELAATVRSNPNNIDARMRLAQAFSVAGRDKDATEQYKAVLSVNKDYVPALSGLGFTALKQKQFKTSESYYRKIIKLLEGNVPLGGESALESAYFYLGTALLEQKEWEDAAANFKESLRLRRDASDTHYALAVCMRELGNEDAYRESLENALLFDPQMPEPNYDLGMILLAEKKLADAAEHFRTSADAAPSVDKPREELEKLGPLSTRIAAAKKALSADPETAVTEARIAAAIDPNSVEALTLLAQAREATGDKESAAAAYKRILTIEPQDATATEGLKRVTDGSE